MAYFLYWNEMNWPCTVNPMNFHKPNWYAAYSTFTFDKILVSKNLHIYLSVVVMRQSIRFMMHSSVRHVVRLSGIRSVIVNQSRVGIASKIRMGFRQKCSECPISICPLHRKNGPSHICNIGKHQKALLRPPAVIESILSSAKPVSKRNHFKIE